MPYPSFAAVQKCLELFARYAELKHEHGAKNIPSVVRKLRRKMEESLRELRVLPVDEQLAAEEPNDLDAIRALRPKGPNRIWERFEASIYREKLEGAMLARFAGCTLGSPVESWPVEKMEELARENGDPFPPVDYWRRVPEPFRLQYGISTRQAYTRSKMSGVPADDDIAYTLLGLLIIEEFGPDFTVADVGRAWVKYLPYACTAERVALANLKKGMRAEKAAEKDNPYTEWIGAAIRADPWGYLAAGWPERAAEMAWRDAFISHRRNGIYGAMFLAAAIAAAFAVNHPLEAVELGLSQIPRRCALARAIRWSLKSASSIRDYRQARAAVDRRFKGMHGVHTINNSCLTVFGLAIGGTDVTRVLAETVAMGLDNDCTAATAGSIVGAVVGKRGVPRHWHRRFNNVVHSYLIGEPLFRIDDLAARFESQAARVWGAS